MTRWCGPYALSLISGRTYEDAYAFAKKKLKKRAIMGMYNHQFKAVARALGFKKFEWDYSPRSSGRPTLRLFADWMKPNRLYVVQLTRHYVTVNTKDWTVQCNLTGKWEPLAECRTKKKKVCAFAEVKRIET